MGEFWDFFLWGQRSGGSRNIMSKNNYGGVHGDVRNFTKNVQELIYMNINSNL